MPELPEVETTRRGIEPHIKGQTVDKVIIRQAALRWPIPNELADKLTQQTIKDIHRRAKYLILVSESGCVIIHLGMSGSLRIAKPGSIPRKHDHVDFVMSNNKILRFHDPRRFGCILWHEGDIKHHILLKSLGPEPLSGEFNGELLFNKSRKRKLAVKNFIMDAKIVVGVGNIYASEALYMSGIRPTKPAGRVSLKAYKKLSSTIRRILNKSIKQGGTTLRDFVNEQGEPGYFAQKLNVYGRNGEPCKKCKTTIKVKTIGQRSSFYCPHCQR